MTPRILHFWSLKHPLRHGNSSPAFNVYVHSQGLEIDLGLNFLVLLHFKVMKNLNISFNFFLMLPYILCREAVKMAFLLPWLLPRVVLGILSLTILAIMSYFAALGW